MQIVLFLGLLFVYSCSSPALKEATPKSSAPLVEVATPASQSSSALTFEGAIQTRREELKKCYKLYGNLQPGVLVSYDFTIRYNGELQSLDHNEARSKGGNSALKICIRNELQKIKYPEVIGYDRAFYNYTFSF